MTPWVLRLIEKRALNSHTGSQLTSLTSALRCRQLREGMGFVLTRWRERFCCHRQCPEWPVCGTWSFRSEHCWWFPSGPASGCAAACCAELGSRSAQGFQLKFWIKTREIYLYKVRQHQLSLKLGQSIKHRFFNIIKLPSATPHGYLLPRTRFPPSTSRTVFDPTTANGTLALSLAFCLASSSSSGESGNS